MIRIFVFTRLFRKDVCLPLSQSKILVRLFPSEGEHFVSSLKGVHIKKLHPGSLRGS
jgi:hypothetical protein